MRITRVEILNGLIRRFGLSSYLEIGVAGGASFKRIEAREKVGVDPAFHFWYLLNPKIRRQTSDRFFARNRRTFDLIFIDGLHIAEQAYRDIQNALAVLNPGGFILVHDCLPTSREQQEVPRAQVSWTGNVWRAFLKASQQPELSTLVFEANRGCGLIRRQISPAGGPKPPADLDPLGDGLSWESYEAQREQWLRFVPPEETFAVLEQL
jgi:hypothetical protein